MRIALTYNLRPEKIELTDPALEQFIEGDEWKTIEAVGKAIINNGHEVAYFPVEKDIYEKIANARDNIDLLFNLAEGITTSADREAQVPMIAEILGIPHTGPGPLSAALILNKTRAKEIWRANGVATAASYTFRDADEPVPENLHYPLLVKPNGEGSGIGIRNSSRVQNEGDLRYAVEQILTEYKQPAIAEEYLPGREFTVAIVGNGKELVTLPIIEINFAAFPPGAAPIDTYEAKFVYGVTGAATETEFCPAEVTPEMEKAINDLAKRAYRTIGCADFGRVDIRLDAQGKPVVMEINHPPGLMSDPDESSFFTISARTYGWDMTKMIGEILQAAQWRLKLGTVGR